MNTCGFLAAGSTYEETEISDKIKLARLHWNNNSLVISELKSALPLAEQLVKAKGAKRRAHARYAPFSRSRRFPCVCLQSLGLSVQAVVQ